MERVSLRNNTVNVCGKGMDMFLLGMEDACITVVGWKVKTVDICHGRLGHEPRKKRGH